MNAILLDTNIVSYAARRDSRFEWYQQQVESNTPCISFMTLGEIHFGMKKAGWGRRRVAEMREYLTRFQVIYVDDDLCEVWGDVTSNCHAVGFLISSSDAWIAATALAFELPLLTHNPRHFEPVDGLTVMTAPQPS